MSRREVEQKYRVDCDQLEELRNLLQERAGEVEAIVEETDVYLSHPCRDLWALDEALRVRYVNGRPRSLTYKGPRAPRPLKDRQEINLEISGDPIPILEALGFRRSVEVVKFRIYISYKEVLVTLDRVEGLGCFVEVESKTGDEASIKDAINELKISGEPVNETYAEMVARRRMGAAASQ